MPPHPTPLATLRAALAEGRTTPAAIAEDALAHANQNTSRNTYTLLDATTLRADAAALPRQFPESKTRPPLYGIPVSLKDCFDLARTPTTCGTHFYAALHGVAQQDSAVAACLRSSGCLITGKTHLHPLAYGITGENPDFGDCLQPRDPTRLTGGSSSGAAASVQEGSALFAIGTDTGGSIRVPAALCGLAGYRASHLLTDVWPALWQGATPLAPSFDTLGMLTRDARDLPLLAHTIFKIPVARATTPPNIGYVPASFLHDASSSVLEAYDIFQRHLKARACYLETIDTAPWHDSLDIFAGIQASEAAGIHRGHFNHFPALIASRLHWGASLMADEITTLRARHETFRAQLATLFAKHDFLILPAAPVSELRATNDHSRVRPLILRYTTPFSLGGNPVVTLPGEMLNAPSGTGLQIAAAPGQDAHLLAFAASLVPETSETL